MTGLEERLKDVTIHVRHDFDPLFAALASLPSVVARGDSLELPIGPTTQLHATKSGHLTLTKITPLGGLPELLDAMRAKGNERRSVRPTPLHLWRDDFILWGFREQRGSTTEEAGYACIPVFEPGEDAAVMAALEKKWGPGSDELIHLFGSDVESRKFGNGWWVVDLRRYRLVKPTSQLLLFYAAPLSELAEIGPSCLRDE